MQKTRQLSLGPALLDDGSCECTAMQPSKHLVVPGIDDRIPQSSQARGY